MVCASPESIKSLMLKYVELSHSLESADMDVLVLRSKSARRTREARRIRDVLMNRSEMSDAIVKIFDLWQQGALIMDEVDVLLHPLKSELNFPIGQKDPIDMAGYRWELPIHLIDALFHHTQGRTTGAPLSSEEERFMSKFDAMIKKGYKCHALQRNPHVVLLSEAFYEQEMKPLVARWALIWIQKHVSLADITDKAILDFLTGGTFSCAASSSTMKFLNLARNWVTVLFPHIIGKIDRVTFGVLNAADLAAIDPKTPQSRKLMAVPFVGKDVPSRSSEFAHPDVVIGLTILGYRYEGLRKSDLRRIVKQLKSDFIREVGPRDQRPSAVLFRSWLVKCRDLGRNRHLSDDDDDEMSLAMELTRSFSADNRTESLPVLPLPLFQPTDPKQLSRLYELVKRLPEVAHYYLNQHVFPACMNFQNTKISACGHELGSSILFRHRIGFSGTPSNLLPVDLGTCKYEKGSDGKMLVTLTDENVATVLRVGDSWDARGLLRTIASDGAYNSLIDTGALITGMDNEQVARYLLEHLPRHTFDGVVFLDRSDRKMFMQREGRCISLSQSGVDPARRFTFYDQVHTTGMDISQSVDARACLTLGKDMTFRDYVQGAYRMRGIGKGQTVHVLLIPEVENLIRNELSDFNVPSLLISVPAWLLINSMRTESLQSMQLGMQEIYCTWRKRALNALLSECREGVSRGTSPSSRMMRFSSGDNAEWRRKCIALFREAVGFEVPDHSQIATPFRTMIDDIVRTNAAFMLDDADALLVNSIVDRMTHVSAASGFDELQAANRALTSEVVHEAEQEEQQEEEQEEEQEKIKMSAFTRDDEQANPWLLSSLAHKDQTDAFYYQMSDFVAKESQPKLKYPPNLNISDNVFRQSWVGIGDRRLRTVAILLEWIPMCPQRMVSAS